MLSNRYVALLDILGFSRMVRERPLEQVVAKVQSLLRMSESRASKLLWTPGTGLPRRTDVLEVHRYHFSDTLLFWSRSVDETNIEFERQISVHFYSFLCELVSSALFERIPLRGAITYGPTFADSASGVIVGQTIIDAHELEQAQDWIGVALHTSCVGRSQHSEAGRYLVRYAAPLKDYSKTLLSKLAS